LAKFLFDEMPVRLSFSTSGNFQRAHRRRFAEGQIFAVRDGARLEVTRDSAIAGASVLRGSFQKFGESLFRWNNMSDRHVPQPTPCVQEVSALPP